MLKTVVAVIFLVSSSLGQSSNSLFMVRHTKNPHFVLSAAQMGEAEKLYQSACVVVQQELHSNKTLHPRFTVVLGSERNEIHGETELWLKEWNPKLFTEAVVVFSFYEMLPVDLKIQLTKRALQYGAATVDVTQLRQDH
jgi:hypothetical protein